MGAIDGLVVNEASNPKYRHHADWTKLAMINQLSTSFDRVILPSSIIVHPPSSLNSYRTSSVIEVVSLSIVT